jgi:hypothetical protein
MEVAGKAASSRGDGHPRGTMNNRSDIAEGACFTTAPRNERNPGTFRA